MPQPDGTPAARAPRIPPQPPADWDDAVRPLLTADLGEGNPLGARTMAELNLFTTVARDPAPFKPWVLLGRKLLADSAFSFRERELVILRTGLNCRAPYEWGQHVRIALDGGIPRAEVDRVAAGPDATGWDDRTRTLLRAADELHADATIAATTWTALAAHLDERELIELPLLVGYYHLVAFALNALGIQPETDLEPLPSC